MAFPRSSGILLHPTSLPGANLGADARAFVDWLAAAGQTWWQILPLGPPDKSGSPYAAASAFAGWPGLLAEPEAPVSPQEIEAFVAAHPYWIGAWAAHAGGEAIADQVRFDREWTALRRYAAERGVRIIGDLPIYVAPGGADHLSQPELFQTGLVAGVPPDDWSATGQLWGNPLYDWEAMRASGFRWWIERFRRTFELVDVTRIDHFRALVAYWAVPARNRTARQGSWHRAPGRELLSAVRGALADTELIAEDLGVITEPVERLRDDFNLPGMVVLQFAFSEGMRNPQKVGTGRRNSVIYTGTHDNPTTAQWWDEADEVERTNARRGTHRCCGAPLGDDRVRPGLHQPAGHPARPGRARPGCRSADEHPRARGGQLELAPGTGPAHQRVGQTYEDAHRTRKTGTCGLAVHLTRLR